MPSARRLAASWKPLCIWLLGKQGIAAEGKQVAEPGKADLVMVYHRLPWRGVPRQGWQVTRRRPTSPNGIIPTLLSFFGDGRAGS